jgi:hypothetical protein
MVRGGKKAQLEYLKNWRGNNQHTAWLNQRNGIARRLERQSGRVTILGVRVDWRNRPCA